jgi:hypothetical protein
MIPLIILQTKGCLKTMLVGGDYKVILAEVMRYPAWNDHQYAR